MIVRVIIYAVVIVSATLFMLVTLNEMIKRKSKAPTSYRKAPLISILGGPSHYYVENYYGGKFALVEAALLPKLEGRKDSLGTPLFIRPMHGEENWDKTINHEEQFDKIYCVLDKSNIEDFLAD